MPTQGAILFVKFPIPRGVLYNKAMDNLLPENEYYSFENRVYSNPQADLDRSNAFINNLRDVQQESNQLINQQTRNLGTEISSNLGGLVGGEGYWTSRYQTPQMTNLTSNLRATAQAQALNELLANEKAMWEKRYNDAYRNYQKRSWDRSGGGGNLEGGLEKTPSGEEEVFPNENEVVLPQPSTTDVGVVSSMNAIADITGQGKVPTTTYTSGVLIDKNGNRTAMRVYPGQGISVAGGMDYTKSGARQFLSNWVKSGGKVSNGTDAPQADNYSLNMLAWDLY